MKLQIVSMLIPASPPPPPPMSRDPVCLWAVGSCMSLDVGAFGFWILDSIEVHWDVMALQLVWRLHTWAMIRGFGMELNPINPISPAL